MPDPLLETTLEDPQTIDDWYKKLKSWIPSWYFLDEIDNVNSQSGNQVAHLYALARILSYNDQQAHEHVRSTFIEYAEGSVLDEMGRERKVLRLPGELDAQYRIRIRNISFNGDCPTLKQLIDSVLIAGESKIIEDWNSSLYFNRDFFYNRGDLLLEKIENVFTILVDKQLHEPYSFFDREYFYNRGDFVGTGLSSEYVFELIKAIVDENKAKGTLYRVVEKIGS